ncbi:MAG: 16S rRNA (cytosine(1402)-N(4))-methyltransferase RsmH [Calditrichaeota bacterium]|nr:MAG: 16S rRNA (cytosine(1402)-N(4))-methyltransferase RsmH [Calditrichota bacterium]
MKQEFHQPVLMEEAGKFLIQRLDGIYVDCTLGGGGHSAYILEHLSPEAFLIGLDADADAISHARERLSRFPNVYLRQAFYDQLEVVLVELGKYPVDGVLYDLGISSYQVDNPQKGFSYQAEGPLDMRFDPVQQKVTAADVVNRYPREELERVIREYGEERHWRAIAREIVEARQVRPFQTTGELVDVIRTVVGERFLVKTLSRVFQALRIEVNQELRRLSLALDAAFRMLREGGRLVVISYHSLEDRIVKRFLQDKQKECVCPPDLPRCVCDKVQEMKILTRKPIVPGPEEIRKNPRARSARMRVGEKVVPFSME